MSENEEKVKVEETQVEPKEEKKPSFVDKFKSVFNKKAKADTQEGEAGVLSEEMQEINSLVSGSTLSTGEKVKRFLKSQSGWLFVLPALVLMCVFTLYPIINSFIGAFKLDYDGVSYSGWGFDNFTAVLKGNTGTGGATFLQCLVNTLIFTLISVPLSTILALLISVALSNIKALQKAYQTILFLPYLTNALAMGAVFATFFQIIGTTNNTETVGLVNNFLGLFGIQPVDWMDGSGSFIWGSLNIPLKFQVGSVTIPWARYFVVIVYEVWSGLPFKILILFSALQSVNKQYYDAAKIDGASKSTVLWKITTPLISPMISYLLVTGIMGGMKQYSAVVGLFGPEMGKNYSMGTMVGYIYQYLEGDDVGRMGYAFAGSILLFAIIMVITAINRRLSKKRVKF